MDNTFSYKGYIGSTHYAAESGVYYGQIRSISALTIYYGSTREFARLDFERYVDYHLTTLEVKDG